MKRIFSLFLLMLVALMFSGCGFFGDDGRMDAWKAVEMEKEKTKQELLKAKQAGFAAGNGQEAQKRNPTLKITTQDSAGKPVTVEQDLAPLMAAATGHSPDGENGNTYGIKVGAAPMPKGAVAEGLEATGNAVTKIANSPAVVVGAAGAAIVGALDKTGGGQKIDVQGDFNAKDSFNRQEQITIGQNQQPLQKGTQDATAPVIVPPADPVIVPPSYPPASTTPATTAP